MGLLGMTMVKNSLCYVWLFEYMAKENKSSACSFINFVDWMQPLIACWFFMKINADWYPFFMGYTIIGIVSFLLITFLCPESPKWLLLQGKTKEAINVLNKIAMFNRSKERISPNTKFVEAMISDNLEHTHTLDNDATVSKLFTELSYRATRYVPPRNNADKKKKNS